MCEKQHINWHKVGWRKSGKLFADTFLDYVNGASSRSNEQAIDTMLGGHRTLQQQAFQFCLNYIKGMAEQEFHDPRNEFSVKTAKEIMKFLESKDLGTHAPLI